MSILDDVGSLGKIGMFVLLFIICIAAFTGLIEELGLVEEGLGIPSHESEYNNLNFILGFSILLSIGGMVFLMFRSRARDREQDTLREYDNYLRHRFDRGDKF